MSTYIVVDSAHVRQMTEQLIKSRQAAIVHMVEVRDAEIFKIARVAETSAMTQARIASCSAIQASQLSSGRFKRSAAGQALNQQV